MPYKMKKDKNSNMDYKNSMSYSSNSGRRAGGNPKNVSAGFSESDLPKFYRKVMAYKKDY